MSRLPFQIPEFDLPAPVAQLNNRLPQLPPTAALTFALNAALGRLLPKEGMEPLMGKLLSLNVTDAGLNLRFTLTEEGFRPAVSRAAPDVSITARVCDFLALASGQEDPDTLFFSRRLLMEGDTELGLLVKNTLAAIDPPRLPDIFAQGLPSPFEVAAKVRAHFENRNTTSPSA